MRRTVLAALAVAVVVLASAPALAAVGFYYLGPHAGGAEHDSFCTIRVRHSHAYEPADTKVFRIDHGTYVFIGDPVAHGYHGRHFTFYGHHPVPRAWGGHWCFIDGPHYHFYRPVRAHFRFQGGSYYYVGVFTDPWYVRNRTVYEPVLAHHYAGRSGYVRPTIVAAPPRAYVGPRVVVSAAHHAPPVVQVRSPAVHGAAPAVHGAAPAVHGAAPAVHGAAPAVHRAGPAVHPAAPVVPRGRPAAHPAGPAAHSAGPAAHGATPAAHPAGPAVHSGPGVRDAKVKETPHGRDVKPKDGPHRSEGQVKAPGPQAAPAKPKEAPHGREVKAKQH